MFDRSVSYGHCTLCAHRCGVDRTRGERGVCGMGSVPVLARAALHFYEEPPITGRGGSGTVFFSGCSLRCIYCQNREISRGQVGREVGEEALSEIFLSLRKKGAENINLVTPTHFVPSIIKAVARAKEKGLSIPVVYNTSSYDTPETIDVLAGTADIFLADCKYASSVVARRYSGAPRYPEAAFAAIDRMVALCPRPVFDGEGRLRRGVLVRLLLLPGHVANSRMVLRMLYRRYGNTVLYSLMNQYTPPPDMPSPLHRPVTRAEYRELLAEAERLGIPDAFIQEEGTVGESFIPPFDLTGIE